MPDQRAGTRYPSGSSGVKWATRRRIFTIPNDQTSVEKVIGPKPWPLGTIIRYRDSGAMFRWRGWIHSTDFNYTPWQLLRDPESNA